MKISKLQPSPILAPKFVMATNFRTVTTVKGAPGTFGHILDGGIPGEELASLITSMDDLNELIEHLFGSREIARRVASLFPANGRLQSVGTVSTTPKQVSEVVRRSVQGSILPEFIGGIIQYSLSTAGLVDKAHARLTPVVRSSRMAQKDALVSAVISMEVLDVVKGTDFKLNIPAKSTIRNILEERIYTMLSTLGRMLAKRMITITDTVNEGLAIVRASLEEETGIVPQEERLDPSIAKNAELEKLTADVAVVHAALTAPASYVTLSNSRIREVLSTLWTAISTAPWLSHESVAEFLSHYGTIRLRNNYSEYNAVIVYANYNHHQESPVGMIFPHGFNSTDTDADYEIMAEQMSIANGALDNLLPDSPIKNAAHKAASLLPSLLRKREYASLINVNLSEEELNLFSLLANGITKLVSIPQDGPPAPGERELLKLQLVTEVRVEDTPVVDKSLVSDFAGIATVSDAPVALLYVQDKEPTTAISIKSHNIPADLLSRSVLTKSDPEILRNLAGTIQFPFKIADTTLQVKISMLEAIGVRAQMPRKVEMMLNQQYPMIVQTVVDTFRELEQLRLTEFGKVKQKDQASDFEYNTLKISIAKELYNMLSAVGMTDRGKVIRHSMLQQIKNSSNASQREMIRYETHRRHLNDQLNVQVGMLIIGTLRLVEREDRDFIMKIINETNIYSLVS